MSHGLPVSVRCFHHKKSTERRKTTTQQQYIIKRKLNILDFAEQLGNISEACKKLGVSRQHYYDIKGALEEHGVDGLLAQARNKPRIGNRVPESIEKRVLDYSLEFPTHGQVRVANELKQEGVVLSPGGVRSIWLRHGLEKKRRMGRSSRFTQVIFSDKIPFTLVGLKV